MTDGGYTMSEAWNLQLQHRVENLERVLGALVGLTELTGPSNLKSYKSLLDEARVLLHGDPKGTVEVERLLNEDKPDAG
jgi:hypothetical protein